MHVVGESRNLAARAGRWSAQHRKLAIWGWLGLVFLLFVLGNAVKTVDQEQAQSGVGESGRASATINRAFPKHVTEEVLIQSKRVPASDPSFRAVVEDVQHRLAATPYARAFESPYAAGNKARISRDGRSALLRFQIAGKESQVKDRVSSTLNATSAAQAAHPDFTVAQMGEASIEKQIGDVISEDFKRALVTSLPITLIILLITFGAVVAALIPLLLALTAVMGTIGIVALISHLSPVDQSINEVILLIGLAVGVDYSMFYLRREREERERGASEDASLAAAAATSGRAVLVSGLTVMLAMAGMYLAGAPTFESFATGTIIVVAVAVVGSLTVLPALLCWLGDRVEKGGVPIISQMPWNAGESGLWARVLNPVLRHPVISVIASAGVLGRPRDPGVQPASRGPRSDLAASEPESRENLQQDPGDLPRRHAPSRGGGPLGDVTSPEVAQAIQTLRERAAASPLFRQPSTLKVNAAAHGRRDRHPDDRGRQQRRLLPGAGSAAEHAAPRHSRAAAEHDCRRDGSDGKLEGLQ